MPGDGRNILALDIAFGPASACLLCRDGRSFVRASHEERPHSLAIIPLLQSLLQDAGLDWRELDMLAAGIGPGSFTGLRIAAATLAGVNCALQRPVIELSSLAISAAQCPGDDALFVIEDARAGQAYLGHYRHATALQADRGMAWSDIRSMPAACYTAHRPAPDGLLPGWEFVAPQLPREQAMLSLLAGQNIPSADPDTLPRLATPAYLMSSQAERHAPKL